jgi:hypothetical protein
MSCIDHDPAFEMKSAVEHESGAAEQVIAETKFLLYQKLKFCAS